MEASPPDPAAEIARFYRAELAGAATLGAALTGDVEEGMTVARDAFRRAARNWSAVRDLPDPAGWVWRAVVVAAQRRPASPEPGTTSTGTFWHALRALPDGERVAMTIALLDGRSSARLPTVLGAASADADLLIGNARAALAQALPRDAATTLAAAASSAVSDLRALVAPAVAEQLTLVAPGGGEAGDAMTPGGVTAIPAERSRPATSRRLAARRGRMFVLAALTAVAAALLIALTVVRGRAERRVPSPPTGTSPAPGTHPPTTPAISPTVVVTLAPIAVAAGQPPPPLEPAVVGQIVPGTNTEGVTTDPAAIQIVVLRSGWASIDPGTKTATVYGDDGTKRYSIPLEDVPDPSVAGPDDVLYGLLPGTERPSIVAVPLGGLAAGMVVAQAPLVGPGASAAMPRGALGLGPGGVVDLLADPGRILMPYLAGSDTTIVLAGAPIVSYDPATGMVSERGRTRWQLTIHRDATWTYPAGPPDIAYPTIDGAIYATTLGPDGDPSGPAPRVIAVLEADGTGRWFSLPAGWELAGSTPFGTLLRRDVPAAGDGSTPAVIEVARLPATGGDGPP